ncbi:hypothetical protein ACFY41_03085 [Streptomyces syringium]|uniref:hypothetical protein n=1 Tax=Streptomyces syringium TaxID=76729 RepID=UPI0036782A6E
MNFRIKVPLIAGAVLAGLLGVGAPAQANDAPVARVPSLANTTKTCIPWFVWPLGDVCFDSNGDKFILNDLREDGKRLVVRWVAHDGSGRSGECHDADGADNGPKICNYNFREGKNFYIEFGAMIRNGAHGRDEQPSVTLRGYVSPR